MLDKEKYIAEAHRQLSDERFYTKLDSDPTEEFSATITKTLEEMHKKNEIGDNVYETLNPIDCRPGQFYLLPKSNHFHKYYISQYNLIWIDINFL